MYKRGFALFLVFVLLLSIPVPASATESATDESIIYLEDGSYITITIEESVARASGSKTGRKTYNYNAANGNLEWQAVLTGTFTYTGTTSTCTASSVDVTVYESNWYLDSKTATKSGAVATATVVMGRTVFFITISKESYNLSLSCDKDGNLS